MTCWIQWTARYGCDPTHPSRRHAIEFLRKDRENAEHYACMYLDNPDLWPEEIQSEYDEIETIRQALALLGVDE